MNNDLIYILTYSTSDSDSYITCLDTEGNYLWHSADIEVPDTIIASSKGSIFISTSEETHVGLYRIKGEHVFLITTFGAILLVFWIICVLICFLLCLVVMFTEKSKLKSFAMYYLASSGPIEAILIVKTKEPIRKCVCYCCIIPRFRMLKPFDIILLTIYGLVLQLLIATLIVVLTIPECEGTNVHDFIGNCNWPIWVSVVTTAILTVILLIPLRATAASCTSSSMVNGKQKYGAIGYIFFGIMFIGTLAIIIWQNDAAATIVVSWALSVVLDWFTKPLIGILCCFNCFCVRDLFGDDSDGEQDEIKGILNAEPVHIKDDIVENKI